MDLRGVSDSSNMTSEDPYLSSNIRPPVGVEDLDTMGLLSQGAGNLLLNDPVNPNADPSNLPPGDIEDLWLQDIIYLSDLRIMAEFVKVLQSTTLDDPSLGMSAEALYRLQNLPYEWSLVAIDKLT
jgi:hypothetical protein